MNEFWLNDLRESFLDFFKSKGHLRLKSFSLIPENDKSLLLVNSGMAPMKVFFAGTQKPPRKRIVTCQKCVRTPDIEQVGVTSRHGTFFEMLGNFSFGDYFKEEAISFAFEFCTKVVGLPSEKLVVSVFEKDKEAYELWRKITEIPTQRIVRFGKENNFWEHGPGPCGPCSEIYFDRGEKYGCKKSNCALGCDCDRYVEIWNLVFTQFSSDGDGNYEKLRSFNIDTGMGLERLAMIVQGAKNFFLVDTIKNVLSVVCEEAGIVYGKDEKRDTYARIVTDHIRSAVFMASDGIIPSGDGRGYVMRKLIRRAIRCGRILGLKGSFLSKICEAVTRENKKAYEELGENLEFTKKVLSSEEESFSRTVDQGLLILNRITSKPNFRVLSGEDAFLLHDTYGFPIELTKEILKENGFEIDADGFEKLILKQRERSNAKASSSGAWGKDFGDFDGNFSSKFVGYDTVFARSKILGIFKDEKNIDFISFDKEDVDCFVVLDKTPFYPEGGGQVSDTGTMKSDTTLLTVLSSKKVQNFYIHRCVLKKGSIKIGDFLDMSVDLRTRKNTSKNHTAAHLLHSALRIVLGEHVRQAGQLVDSRRLRFDFSHFSKLTKEEVDKIEDEVNKKILDSIKIDSLLMSFDEAKRSGATALFTEKYGDVVRVVKIGNFSSELCAGTHVSNTSEICFFKIASESSVGAGVRRLEAFTGVRAMEFAKKYQDIVFDACRILKQNNVIKGINNLLAVNQKNIDLIRKFEDKFSSQQAQKLLEHARDPRDFPPELGSSIKIVTQSLIDLQVPALRIICDKIVSKAPEVVGVISSSVGEDGVFLVVCVGPRVQELGIGADSIIKGLSKLAGGGGGGNSKIATARISSKDKIPLVFDSVDSVILGLL
ncbi:MAG: alanine--tRNA ligase [Oscillospiraceae bacterium]|nr:alanine--tRNA ligase [Oscillospiraceae bacterium]